MTHDERRLQRTLGTAWAALLWESLWPRLWPPVAVLGLFVGLALLDLLPQLPGWLHAALLGLLALAVVAGLVRGLLGLRLPDWSQAKRRVERVSALPHRPLSTLEDELSGNADLGSRRLWQLHQARARLALKSLRAGLPRPGLTARDPYALRAAVFLLLVIGISVGGADPLGRLARAVSPDFSGPPPAPAELEVWLNPPTYTGMAPRRLLVGAGETAIDVPQSSELLARLFGGAGEAQLWIDDAAHPFQEVDNLNRELRMSLEQGTALKITQGDAELAAWRLNLIPDNPPTVALAEPPAATPRATLRLHHKAEDDYGLVAVEAEIRLRERSDVEPLIVALPLTGVGGRGSEETSYHDLTAHPWAGLPVTLHLKARDGIEQEGVSETVETVLPERQFTHPVARALIEQRRILTQQPERREQVALALSAISTGPETFAHDLVVYLSLRSAVGRLRYSGDEERLSATIDAVQQQLWETALRIEDGKLSLAERRLREIQQALMDALARNAPDSEIERLMDEMQQAMQEFLQALAEQAQQMARDGEEPMPFDPDAMRMESEDFQRMLDRARELSKLGARDAAREMLRRLQEMLENLQRGPMMAMPQEMEGAQQSMRELNEMMRRQQELLDRSFRMGRQGPTNTRPRQRPNQGQPGQPGQPSDEFGDMAGDQEALRQQLERLLEQLREGLGSAPAPLDRAEGSMGQARDSLQQGQAGDAADAQVQALDEMAQGMRGLADELANRFGRNNEGQGEFGMREEDPLGRSTGTGGADTSRVQIPDQSELQRAREILNELRRRAGERLRPRQELDYIDRLLDRF